MAGVHGLEAYEIMAEPNEAPAGRGLFEIAANLENLRRMGAAIVAVLGDYERAGGNPTLLRVAAKSRCPGDRTHRFARPVRFG
jgi:hypothetical protein